MARLRLRHGFHRVSPRPVGRVVAGVGGVGTGFLAPLGLPGQQHGNGNQPDAPLFESRQGPAQYLQGFGVGVRDTEGSAFLFGLPDQFMQLSPDEIGGGFVVQKYVPFQGGYPVFPGGGRRHGSAGGVAVQEIEVSPVFGAACPYCPHQPLHGGFSGRQEAAHVVTESPRMRHALNACAHALGQFRLRHFFCQSALAKVAVVVGFHGDMQQDLLAPRMSGVDEFPGMGRLGDEGKAYVSR